MKINEEIYEDFKHFHFSDAGLTQKKLLNFGRNLRYNYKLNAVFHPFALKMRMGFPRPRLILAVGAENRISTYGVRDIATSYIGLTKPKLYIMACDRYLSNMGKNDMIPDYVFFASPFAKGYSDETIYKIQSILMNNPKIVIFASETANLSELCLGMGFPNKIFLLQNIAMRMANDEQNLKLPFEGEHNQSLSYSQYITTTNGMVGYALQFLKAEKVFIYKSPYLSHVPVNRSDGVNWIKLESKVLKNPLYTDISYIMGAKHLHRLCQRYGDRLVWLDRDDHFHKIMPGLLED